MRIKISGQNPAAMFMSVVILSSGAIAAPIETGPSSSQSPYVLPTVQGWEVVSLLTVGDSVNNKANGNPYRMVGIPVGLGAMDGGNGQIIVFMNHELGATAGIVRDHGAKGAFVSQWTLDKNTLRVLNGQDLMQRVYIWDATSGSYTQSTSPLARLCSADLPPVNAFYNPATGKGFSGRIFMNGEESGAEGRAFAHIVTGPNAGNSYELPYLGKFSWENSVAHPNTGDKTIVIGMDDSSPGQVYVYIGDKKDTGSEIERAGLTGGKLYGLKASVANEVSATGVSGSLTLVPVFGDGNALGKTGAQLQADSVARGITQFARPEDGAWDPTNPNMFYFVTTDSFNGHSRLYKITFSDIANPDAGMEIASVLNSQDIGGHMFDNMTITSDGKIYIQEDPGNNAYLAATWEFDPRTGQAVKVMVSDASRFVSGNTLFLTQDEENSGIIEITNLMTDADWFEAGRKYFLGVTQAHYNIGDVELVEGGQLYLLRSVPEPGVLGLLGLGLIAYAASTRRGESIR